MFDSSEFDQDIGSWDVSNVVDASFLFSGDAAFDQDISQWQLSNLQYGLGMFYNAASFHQNLCQWTGTMNPSVNLTYSTRGGSPSAALFENTNCPEESNPVTIADGPFCHSCSSSPFTPFTSNAELRQAVLDVEAANGDLSAPVFSVYGPIGKQHICVSFS